MKSIVNFTCKHYFKIMLKFFFLLWTFMKHLWIRSVIKIILLLSLINIHATFISIHKQLRPYPTDPCWILCWFVLKIIVIFTIYSTSCMLQNIQHKFEFIISNGILTKQIRAKNCSLLHSLFVCIVNVCR